MAVCNVCFRHCSINDGELGFCRARSSKDGHVYPINYSRITSLALDPIEKKPLNRFYPGSRILSVGSFGCNLRCPFCQNSEISWDDQVDRWQKSAESLSPKELADIAKECVSRGNIGVAFTDNEPLIGYEYVRDTAKLIHDMGMKNVLVTNGTATKEVYDKLADYIDAMNIDLKCFDRDKYKKVLEGDLDMTMAFIEEAAKTAHIEITCLIVPGISDDAQQIRKMTSWIASIDPEIPLHVSRFHPCFHMDDSAPTPVETVYELAEVARESLKHVYTGNC